MKCSHTDQPVYRTGLCKPCYEVILDELVAARLEAKDIEEQNLKELERRAAAIQHRNDEDFKYSLAIARVLAGPRGGVTR